LAHAVPNPAEGPRVDEPQGRAHPRPAPVTVTCCVSSGRSEMGMRPFSGTRPLLPGAGHGAGAVCRPVVRRSRSGVDGLVADVSQRPFRTSLQPAGDPLRRPVLMQALDHESGRFRAASGQAWPLTVHRIAARGADEIAGAVPAGIALQFAPDGGTMAAQGAGDLVERQPLRAQTGCRSTPLSGSHFFLTDFVGLCMSSLPTQIVGNMDRYRITPQTRRETAQTRKPHDL